MKRPAGCLAPFKEGTSDVGARPALASPEDVCAVGRNIEIERVFDRAVGKCHEVPVCKTSPMGPFTQWPTGGGGFEYFYGFIGGGTNQYYPAIYEGTTSALGDGVSVGESKKETTNE